MRNSEKSRGAKPRWTPQQCAELERMVAEGMFSHEIAAAIGKSVYAVRHRAARMGLDMRKNGQMTRVAVGRTAEHKARWLAALRAGVIAKRADYEPRRAAQISRARMRQVGLGDAPPHVVERYRVLMKSGHEKAADAVALVRDEWSREIWRAVAQIVRAAVQHARAEIARHNSFEARLERVKAGKARVVPVFRPSRALTEARSLTGSSAAMAADGGGL